MSEDPIERNRSAETPMDDDMEVPRHADPESAGGAYRMGDMQFDDDAARMGEEAPIPEVTIDDVLDRAVEDDFDRARGPRSSLMKEREAAEQRRESEARPQGSARKGKRKMILDKKEELQLSTEEMREQLADTSPIVRDLTAAPARAAAGPSVCDGSLLSLANLPHISPEILELSMALMRDNAPPTKKPRGRHAEQRAPEPPEDQPMFTPMPEPPPTGGDFSGGGFTGGADTSFPPPPTTGEPTPVGFDTSHALPDEDGDTSAAAKSSQGASQENDPAAWSMRTQKMYSMLGAAFDESDGAGLSYSAMVAKTGHTGARKRRVVAGCFQELLYLSTHGLIDLAQRRPYGDIIVTKSEAFHATAAKGKKATPRATPRARA